MRNILTFIIPVRHPDNASNWQQVKDNLQEAIRSISQQDIDGWKAVIIANSGADLPTMPPGFSVKWVDFEPNPLYRQGTADKETFNEAVRKDKGYRVLAGMLHAGEMGHVMIVDDDDFVSKHLTSFVAKNPAANGWYIRDGYVWPTEGRLLYRVSNFSRICGTSHIIRADLYKLPLTIEAADESYIKRTLGSHIFMHGHLDSIGYPLAPLPFIGAVYRTAHPENHSRSSGIFKVYFLHKYLLKQPIELCRRISRLRIKTRTIEKEFFGF